MGAMIAFDDRERTTFAHSTFARTLLTDRAFHFSFRLSMTSVTQQPLRFIRRIRERLARKLSVQCLEMMGLYNLPL